MKKKQFESPSKKTHNKMIDGHIHNNDPPLPPRYAIVLDLAEGYP